MKRILGLLITTLILGACSTASDDSQIPASPVPTITETPSQAPSASFQKITIYFASDTGKSFRLFSEQHEDQSGSTDLASAALTALLSGIEPKDSDYVNLWGTDARLNGLTVIDGFATVDIHFEQLNVGAETELRAIEQILWTLKANDPTVNQVEFLKDGNIVETFAGHVETINVFEIDEGYQSLATVDLNLEEGATFISGDLITGLACTFEANVPWELFQNGKLISSSAETAEMACPVRSKFEINLNPILPGEYLIRVWESSMEDGSLINEDTKNFIVQ